MFHTNTKRPDAASGSKRGSVFAFWFPNAFDEAEFGAAGLYRGAADVFNAQHPDPHTVLLCHFDGVDGATNTLDASLGGVGSPRAISFSGHAQIDTAQSKYGGASLLFDGNGDFLQCADSPDWDFGSGDMTIDCWVRVTTVTAKRHTIVLKSAAAEVTSWGLYIVDNQFEFNASSNDSSWNIINSHLFGSLSTST